MQRKCVDNYENLDSKLAMQLASRMHVEAR